MLNDRMNNLPDYAFPRLRSLLDHLPSGSNDPLVLSIGEPQHKIPEFIPDILAQNTDSYNKYPPIDGTPAWKEAVSDWLIRRNTLPADAVQIEDKLLPVNGTREGLFSAALALVPEKKKGRQPFVLMPNPFYQCYAAAAIAAGALPVYLNATAETGFLPDFGSLDEETLDHTALVYMCSPANPQGAVASKTYLQNLIELSRLHDFTLILDECYSEIYDASAPTGGLDAAQSLTKSDTLDDFRNVLVFNSLSKRSNLAGLRSGFVAGDAELIATFKRLRSYGGAPSPIAVCEAAAAAWTDENHVVENRNKYRTKIDLAEQIIGNRYKFYRPEGGFFLWLNVGNGEEAARNLWTKAGVRCLPGAYLSRDTLIDGRPFNPGAAYLRVALVHETDLLERALTDLVRVLDSPSRS